MSNEAIDLAFRTGLPYVGLRDHEHDPELDNLVPPDAARSARALPLTAADDRIRFAVADPEPDLAALTPYLEGKQVELAIAPRDELEEILGPPPPPAAEPPRFEPSDVAEVEAPAAEPEDAAESAEPQAAAEAESDEAAEREEAAPAEPEAAAEAEPDDVAEPEAAAPTEPEAAAEAEPDDVEEEVAEAEPEDAEPAEPEAAPEAEPEDVAEPEAAAPTEPEAVPEAEPHDADEPAVPPAEPDAVAAPVVEHYAFAPGEAGEGPSWLAPPPKRRWLRAIGRFLLYVLVLAIVCGAVAAYLLTR